MAQKYINCREIGNHGSCSVAICGNEEEVLDLAVIHGIITHGHDDPHALRAQLRANLQDVPEAKAALA